MKISHAAAFILVMAGAALAAPAAQAQGGYPDKPIRIVVPYPAGGFNDTLGRVLGGKLSEAWGQPVVVDNKPGAGTQIGTAAAAKAPPDGYTLLVVQFPFAANPWLYKKLPYDTEKDFTPVVLAGRSPMLLAVHSESRLQRTADVIAAARANPGGIN